MRAFLTAEHRYHGADNGWYVPADQPHHPAPPCEGAQAGQARQDAGDKPLPLRCNVEHVDNLIFTYEEKPFRDIHAEL
jgi:hypothetical protein